MVPAADRDHATPRSGHPGVFQLTSVGDHLDYHHQRALDLLAEYDDHIPNDERIEAASAIAQARLHIRLAGDCNAVTPTIRRTDPATVEGHYERAGRAIRRRRTATERGHIAAAEAWERALNFHLITISLRPWERSR